MNRAFLTFAMNEAWNTLHDLLNDLTDHEFFWEPVPGCWRIYQTDTGLWTYDYAMPPLQPSAAATTPDRGLAIIGPPGSGKTTLAVAAARERAVRHDLTLRYASVPQLCEALRREYTEHAPAVLLHKLTAVPVLVLDDLRRERLTSFVREQLYRLLDERRSGGEDGEEYYAVAVATSERPRIDTRQYSRS